MFRLRLPPLARAYLSSGHTTDLSRNGHILVKSVHSQCGSGRCGFAAIKISCYSMHWNWISPEILDRAAPRKTDCRRPPLVTGQPEITPRFQANEGAACQSRIVASRLQSHKSRILETFLGLVTVRGTERSKTSRRLRHYSAALLRERPCFRSDRSVARKLVQSTADAASERPLFFAPNVGAIREIRWG